MSKVRIICDSTVQRSVILHGNIGPKAAYDAALDHAAAPSTWRFLELKAGVNEIDIDAEDLKSWQSLARDAGLVIAEARPASVYVLTDLMNGANSGVRYPGIKRS